MSMDYMQNLNPEQIQAVTTLDGPLLVLSGAGTGKTRVLTSRIVHLLHENKAYPWEILALTFTNKAANEMRFRIAQYPSMADNCRDLWMGTFHSVCLRILKMNHVEAGLRSDFLVYGEDDQKTVLKHVMANLGLDPKVYVPGDWVEKISNIKDKGIFEFDKLALSPIANKILNEYNAELAGLGAVDFGDIILLVLKMFENNPTVLEKYQKKFQYILVDEFQDTNAAQMRFLRMLTKHSEHPNICCVGDDDQSIYSWRGSEIKNILEFEQTYPGAKIIRLETNYRSTGNILGAANSLIKHNTGRLGKDLRVAPDVTDGAPVYVFTVATDWDEARFIADSIIRNSHGNYSDYVVLIRAGSLSKIFEETFAEYKVPYRLIGATKFYARTEIRDVIAYTRLLVYPFDDISFERIISKPSRNIGPAAIVKLREIGGGLMNALKSAKLSAKQQQNAQVFLSAFDFDWQNMDPKDAVQTLLENTGYMNMWRESKDADAQDRMDNIRDLLSTISNYNNLPEFLEHAALMTADDNDAEGGEKNVVNIMTIHAAKGLEFNTVFLPAWEEGVFPNDKTTKEGDLEEERRLAYVAITRAKKWLVITNAMVRSVFGQRQYQSPSRFIGEIDKRFIRTQYDAANISYQKNEHKTKYESNNTLVGKMVAHREFGTGVVVSQDGDKLTVAFKTKGLKNVMRDFVKIL
ncbi:MAG: UvrD-helicase domain-containing protein [Alphaproteobacteria bacterium]|nr:UvrD-helicase domain-containing protein [Alphaproteobacteria bacterium]